MIPAKVKKFLDASGVKYELLKHKTVYTAYDKAATLRVKPSAIGKTLVLKTDRELAIVLIPGNKNLDKNKFKKVAKVKKADFVSEAVMKNRFKGVKPGAIPPFGGIFKRPVFVDNALLKEKNIFVNAGSYKLSLKLSPKVFEKLQVTKGLFSKPK